MNFRFFLGVDHAFEPDEITLMVMAYESALRELRLVEREDRITLIVAKRIIELAKLGERDPANLCAAAVAAAR